MEVKSDDLGALNVHKEHVARNEDRGEHQVGALLRGHPLEILVVLVELLGVDLGGLALL